MNTDPRRFAPLGLILAIIAVISLFILVIIYGFVSGGVVNLTDTSLLVKGIGISAAVIVLGLALTAFLDPERTRRFFTGRQLQYGSNAVIMLIAFIGILFFINMIAFQNPKTWDWTEDQQNTLAPETINILQKLPQPVNIVAYYSTSISKDDVQKLLDNLRRESNGNLTFDFLDPNYYPGNAASDGVTRDGTLVAHMGQSKELVSSPTEKDIDSAIMRLVNPVQKTVYFLTGHGELDMQGGGDPSASMAQVKAALESKNYTVKSLNLNSQGSVPADGKVLVIAGPQKPLGSDDVSAIETYLNNGGAVIIMEEPNQLTKFGNSPDPLADYISAKWGVTLQNDIVLDGHTNNPLVAVADPQKYASHPITDPMRGFNSLFPTTRSISLAAPAPENITLTPLAQTVSDPSYAYGETDYSSIMNSKAANDPASDLQPPLVLAAAGENATTKGRLVVFGDSVIATDPAYQSGYSDILINSVDWGAQQESLINLTPKNSVTRTFKPPETPAFIGTLLLSLCVIPFLVVVGGVAAWFSKRRRG